MIKIKICPKNKNKRNLGLEMRWINMDEISFPRRNRSYFGFEEFLLLLLVLFGFFFGLGPHSTLLRDCYLLYIGNYSWQCSRDYIGSWSLKLSWTQAMQAPYLLYYPSGLRRKDFNIYNFSELKHFQNSNFTWSFLGISKLI